jgi:hypothetical protein
LWTIRLTAKGASASVNAAPISCNQASKVPEGRALSDGKAPTIRALHCAMTSSGRETRNIGEPISGSDKRPSSSAGRVIEQYFPRLSVVRAIIARGATKGQIQLY